MSKNTAAIEFKKFKEQLKTSEKHLFLLIKTAKPIDAREVITRDGKRFELVLNNNLKIKCTKKLALLFNKEPKIIYSNY